MVGPAVVLLLLILFAIIITIIAIVLTRRYKGQFAVVVVITGAHHTPTCAHKPVELSIYYCMLVWLQHPLLVATLGQKLPSQQWERGSSVK